MTDTISLVGLDKAEVLAALYNRSQPQGMGFLHYTATPMTREEAAQCLETSQYFDYLKGRVMKVSLEGDELDPRLYDRDNGQGAAKQVIDELRRTGDTYPETSELSHKENTRRMAEKARENMGISSGPVGGPDGIVTFQLGLGDVSEQLSPKIDQILND